MRALHKRIAIILPFPDLSRSFAGGAIGDTIRFMREASAYKDQIRIFAPHVEDPYPDLQLDMYPASLEGEARLRFLKKRLRLYRPGMIEVHGDQKIALSLSRRFPLTPVLLWHHGVVVLRRHSLWGRATRLLWLRYVVGVSDSVRDQWRTNYPWHKRRIITIRNAIPVADWLGDAHEKERLILFASRSGDHKGFAEFVEGCAKALKALPRWRAAILTVEDMDSYRVLRKAMQARHAEALGARCRWIQSASKAETASWMKRAAIFALPSKWEEPCALALLEAHLSGAAVISSGRGGMKEVSGEEGALCLSDITGATIADAILRLAANDEERQALAKRGQDYALKHHRIEDRAKELDALRREILGAS